MVNPEAEESQDHKEPKVNVPRTNHHFYNVITQPDTISLIHRSSVIWATCQRFQTLLSLSSFSLTPFLQVS